MRIYFDTEFASLWAPTLLSVGMCAEDDTEFYAEVEHDEGSYSDFTRRVVAPLLQGPRYPAEDAARGVRSFLAEHDRYTVPDLVCDFIGDWWLLRQLVPDLREYAVPRCALLDDWQLNAWYMEHPLLPRHHALNDARALRALHPKLQIGTD